MSFAYDKIVEQYVQKAGLKLRKMAVTWELDSEPQWTTKFELYKDYDPWPYSRFYTACGETELQSTANTYIKIFQFFQEYKIQIAHFFQSKKILNLVAKDAWLTIFWDFVQEKRLDIPLKSEYIIKPNFKKNYIYSQNTPIMYESVNMLDFKINNTSLDESQLGQ